LKTLSQLCNSSLKNPLKKNFPINLSIRLAFCLLFFVSHSIPLFSQTPDSLYFDRLLPSSNGNSLRVIHCINQDRQGFIWITSPYGLARYDGNEYILFEHKAGDPSTTIYGSPPTKDWTFLTRKRADSSITSTTLRILDPSPATIFGPFVRIRTDFSG